MALEIRDAQDPEALLVSKVLFKGRIITVKAHVFMQDWAASLSTLQCFG